MPIEFNISTAKGESNLDRLTRAWDRNRDRVVSTTKAYEAQTRRLGIALLENQKYKRSLDSLSAAYTSNQRKLGTLSTTTEVLTGKIKILDPIGI